MDDKPYLETISNLNGGQRKIFDDFVERMNSYQDPFYLYIGGEFSFFILFYQTNRYSFRRGWDRKKLSIASNDPSC